MSYIVPLPPTPHPFPLNITLMMSNNPENSMNCAPGACNAEQDCQGNTATHEEASPQALLLQELPPAETERVTPPPLLSLRVSLLQELPPEKK